MIGEKVATEFLDAIAEKVAEKLLPNVIEYLKNDSILKNDVTMDVNEAALYIGISKEFLYKLCTANGIPHMKLSSTGSGRPRLLFSSSSIDAWRKEQEHLNYRKE
ncbi:Helix-turn-helix domain protein [compost metagenome]